MKNESKERITKQWPCYQAVKLEAQYPSNLLCCFEVKFASVPEMEQWKNKQGPWRSSERHYRAYTFCA